VATATERAIWGVRSTVTAVATLWRAVVDTGSPFNIWSFACTGAGRPCRVTVRGDGQGHGWDKSVAGAGRTVGMVCGGVHGSRVDVKWVLWVECSDEGSSSSFYVPGPWAICGRIPLWPDLGEKI